MKDNAKSPGELTEKEIKHAVRTCRWRHDVGGVPICAGACNICAVEIEKGTCDTLRELFKKKAKEDKNNE